MRQLFFASLLLFAPAFSLGAPQAPLTANAPCTAQAQNILHALQQGSFDAARIANFSPDMKAALASQMNQFWSLLTARFGPFDHAEGARTRIDGGSVNLILPLVFANGHESLHVTCNATGAVIGLFLTPTRPLQKPMAS